jgi:hypothetical protein
MSTLHQDGIEWEFNCPTASHHGGVWERVIRTVRQVLYGLMKEQTIQLDDEGLQTLFCEVEAVINGRLITMASDDPNEPEPLTPNHLLILQISSTASTWRICQTGYACSKQMAPDSAFDKRILEKEAARIPGPIARATKVVTTTTECDNNFFSNRQHIQSRRQKTQMI